MADFGYREARLLLMLFQKGLAKTQNWQRTLWALTCKPRQGHFRMGSFPACWLVTGTWMEGRMAHSFHGRSAYKGGWALSALTAIMRLSESWIQIPGLTKLLRKNKPELLEEPFSGCKPHGTLKMSSERFGFNHCTLVRGNENWSDLKILVLASEGRSLTSQLQSTEYYFSTKLLIYKVYSSKIQPYNFVTNRNSTFNSIFFHLFTDFTEHP